MNKIGIMTMQRINNYGSFLQAYGLKKMIMGLGYEVEFVDFNIEKSIINEEKKGLIDKIIRNKNIISFINKKNYLRKTNRLFENSYWPGIGVSEKNYNPNNIKQLVIGSDEVFNCLQGLPVGYSRELFGKNYESIPVISYAACFGHTTYEGLEKYSINNEISDMLKKFKAISVRDENSFKIVKKLTNISPVLNLDPALMYNFNDELIDNVKISNYILLYAYTGRLTRDEEKEIKKFAKDNNKKIISLGFYQKIADYNLIVHPFEILAYFKHADFIITDTFHGTIFSIKNHSNFCTIVRYGTIGNNNKLMDLIKRLKLENRIAKDIKDIDLLYKKEINWEITDSILENERKKTIDYLKDNLIK